MNRLIASANRPLRRRVAVTISNARSMNAGFTLTELMVVIFIIIVITILVIPVVLGSVRDRKLGEGVRVIQAVLAGARDRAISSGKVCGVRLLRDDNDQWECSRLVYVATPEIYSVGFVDVAGNLVAPHLGPGFTDPHFEFVDPGKDNNLGTADDIPRVVPLGSSIRFNESGPWIRIVSKTNTSPGTLTLAQAAPVSGGPHFYQIINSPAPMAQDAVQNLPAGIVIDLRGAPMPYPADPSVNVPRSRNLPSFVPPQVPFAGADGILGTIDDFNGPDGIRGTADDLTAASWPPIEILFGPNGAVVGEGARSSFVHIWLGERADKGPDPTGSLGPDGIPGTADDNGPARPHTMVTLNTHSGAVQVFHNPGTASADAWPPPASANPNYYSEIYIPAEQLIDVSILP